MSGEVILFGEQETDSSRRIRFSGEADESTLSWNFFFTVSPALEAFELYSLKKSSSIFFKLS